MNSQDSLTQWYSGVKTAQLRHQLATNFYRNINKVTGLTVIIMSCIVGTTIFVFHSNVTHQVPLFVGFISLAAMILVTVQTFFNYAGIAEQHQSTALEYANLRREFEELISSQAKQEVIHRFITSARSRWNSLDQQTPFTWDRINLKAAKILAHRAPTATLEFNHQIDPKKPHLSSVNSPSNVFHGV